MVRLTGHGHDLVAIVGCTGWDIHCALLVQEYSEYLTALESSKSHCRLHVVQGAGYAAEILGEIRGNAVYRHWLRVRRRHCARYRDTKRRPHALIKTQE